MQVKNLEQGLTQIQYRLATAMVRVIVIITTTTVSSTAAPVALSPYEHFYSVQINFQN